MCDRPRLLNPLDHHPTILPFPQQLVSENPLCSERSDGLQRGRNSAIISAIQLFVDRSTQVTEAERLK